MSHASLIDRTFRRGVWGGACANENCRRKALWVPGVLANYLAQREAEEAYYCDGCCTIVGRAWASLKELHMVSPVTLARMVHKLAQESQLR